MGPDISTAVQLQQQPSYLLPTSGRTSLSDMEKPRSRNITAADLAAAHRLKSLWLAMPKKERPTQQQLADEWDLPGSEANQSLISQYMNGRIALHYLAVQFFARTLKCHPEQIRDDLPEQKALPSHSVIPSAVKLQAAIKSARTIYQREGEEFRAEDYIDEILALYSTIRESSLPALVEPASLRPTQDTRPRGRNAGSRTSNPRNAGSGHRRKIK